MTRRQRAYVRRSYHEMARRYLGVKRLSAGVPALINEHVNALAVVPDPHDDTMLHLLRPYRRLRWVL